MLKTKSRREILFLNASWAHLAFHLAPYRPGRKRVFPHLPPALSLRPTQIVSRTVPKATLCDPASATFVIIDRRKSHNPQDIKESTPNPWDLDVGPGVPGTILWNTTTHFHASPPDCGLLFTTSERMPPAGPGRIDGLSGFQSSRPGPHQDLHGVKRNCFFQCKIRCTGPTYHTQVHTHTTSYTDSLAQATHYTHHRCYTCPVNQTRTLYTNTHTQDTCHTPITHTTADMLHTYHTIHTHQTQSTLHTNTHNIHILHHTCITPHTHSHTYTHHVHICQTHQTQYSRHVEHTSQVPTHNLLY